MKGQRHPFRWIHSKELTLVTQWLGVLFPSSEDGSILFPKLRVFYISIIPDDERSPQNQAILGAVHHLQNPSDSTSKSMFNRSRSINVPNLIRMTTTAERTIGNFNKQMNG
jgi:hypothetical protein